MNKTLWASVPHILGRAAPCRKKKNTLPTERVLISAKLGKTMKKHWPCASLETVFIHVSAAHVALEPSHLTDGWKGTFSWLFLVVGGHSNLLALWTWRSCGLGLLSHKQEFPLYTLVSEGPRGQGQIPTTVSPRCNTDIDCWFLSFFATWLVSGLRVRH